MERTFTEDVKTVKGEVRWSAGESRDYNPDTWGRIAQSVGRPLDDFTVPVEEAARRSVTAGGARKKAPREAAPRRRPRRRLTEVQAHV